MIPPLCSPARLCLHKLRKRLSERDRKNGEGGNDEGRKRERQLMKEEEEEMESRKKGEAEKGGTAIRHGFS